jgi:hypothetical protein
MNTHTETEICPTCEIKYVPSKNIFIYSTGKQGTADQVFSRVCGYAKDRNKECINTKGTYVESSGWLDMEPPKTRN